MSGRMVILVGLLLAVCCVVQIAALIVTAVAR